MYTTEQKSTTRINKDKLEGNIGRNIYQIHEPIPVFRAIIAIFLGETLGLKIGNRHACIELPFS